MHGKAAFPAPNARQCVVCAEPLDGRVPLTPRKAPGESSLEFHPLCQASACRTIFAHGSGLPDAAFRRHLRDQARLWREHQAQGRRRKARKEAKDQQAAGVFAALAARAGKGQAPDLRLVVPTGHAPSTRLAAARRQRYATHLDAIIAAAREGPQAPAAPADAITDTSSSLPGRLCAVCGGGCCVKGGDTAYLTAATIRRVMETEPELDDPARLRAAYLARLATRTVSNSCINHTRRGCSLPARLRADICNTFACPALADLEDALASDPPARTALVLRRRQDHWRWLLDDSNDDLSGDIVEAALLTEDGSTRVRLPRTRS